MGDFFAELKRRHVYRVAAACAALACIATPALASKADNSVRFATNVTINSVDPYFNTLQVGALVADQIWDTLIYRDPDTGEYKGNLATSWKWIDEKTLELELRRGVKFHNGADFDADDVVYTLGFVTAPENKIVNTNETRWIDHVEKVEKYRVRIVAKRPSPAAVAFLAFQKVAIFPHEYYARVGPTGMSEHPIGTGPFRVVEHSLGKYIRLERNADHFAGSPKARPKIDKAEIRFIPDPQTRVAEMVAGGLDLLMDVPRDQAEQLRDIPKLQVLSRETVGYSFLAMNTSIRQLRDVKVRQAIMHAIDRGAIVKNLLGESARVLHTECLPSQFGCTDEGVARYAYDPFAARRLLAEAGYPNGFRIDLYAANSASGNRNEVEAVIGYLRAVGIDARLRYLQLAAAISAVRAGKVPIWLSGYVALEDVSDSVSVFHEFGPNDLSRDKEVSDLLVRGDTTLDPIARKDAYAKAFRLIADRAYVLPLHSMANYYIAAKDLDVRPHSDNVVRFYEMSWK